MEGRGEGNSTYHIYWSLLLQYDDQQPTAPSKCRDSLADVNPSACDALWWGHLMSLQFISATMALL
jgi:hypothetical protein